MKQKKDSNFNSNPLKLIQRGI